VSDDFLDPRRAERLVRAARAAHALSETLWEALHEELGDPGAERVAELTEQLREVLATVASLARVRETPATPEEQRPVTSEEREPQIARVRGEPASDEPATGEEPLRLRPEPPEATKPPSPAVLIDELRPGTRPQIEIRDERREGPAAWIGSIGRRLERYERDAAPFAVLLVELVDVGRLHHSEPVGEVSRLAAQVEDALARELRPADSLTSESPGRYWLLAPQTDGMAARMLAERIARAVRSSASHRGTPLEVAIGIAVCPDDGLKASELAAHADVALYAARAAGRAR
jgi:GGDEF domain-containing protein